MKSAIKLFLNTFNNDLISNPYKLVDSTGQFETEFHELKRITEKLKNDTSYSCKIGSLEINRPKNRYKDILPYDFNRVVLSEVPNRPGSDYINTSYIKGASNSPAYLAAQGPLPATVGDFWRMIWECQVKVIVMACNEVESGKYKCECYWPKLVGEIIFIENFVIKFEKLKQICPEFLLRTLSVRSKDGGPSRTVSQFHYTSWPDHGVPTSVQPILQLIHMMRECQPSEAIPILTHCSAGCGRTGTICAIDYVWNLLRSGKIDEKFSLYSIVAQMRRQRIAIVQTKEQYILVYLAVKDLFRQQLQLMEDHTYENISHHSGEPLLDKTKAPIYENLNSFVTGESVEQPPSPQNAESSSPTPPPPPLIPLPCLEAENLIEELEQPPDPVIANYNNNKEQEEKEEGKKQEVPVVVAFERHSSENQVNLNLSKVTLLKERFLYQVDPGVAPDMDNSSSVKSNLSISLPASVESLIEKSSSNDFSNNNNKSEDLSLSIRPSVIQRPSIARLKALFEKTDGSKSSLTKSHTLHSACGSGSNKLSKSMTTTSKDDSIFNLVARKYRRAASPDPRVPSPPAKETLAPPDHNTNKSTFLEENNNKQLTKTLWYTVDTDENTSESSTKISIKLKPPQQQTESHLRSATSQESVGVDPTLFGCLGGAPRTEKSKETKPQTTTTWYQNILSDTFHTLEFQAQQNGKKEPSKEDCNPPVSTKSSAKPPNLPVKQRKLISNRSSPQPSFYCDLTNNSTPLFANKNLDFPLIDDANPYQSGSEEESNGNKNNGASKMELPPALPVKKVIGKSLSSKGNYELVEPGRRPVPYISCHLQSEVYMNVNLKSNNGALNSEVNSSFVKSKSPKKKNDYESVWLGANRVKEALIKDTFKVSSTPASPKLALSSIIKSQSCSSLSSLNPAPPPLPNKQQDELQKLLLELNQAPSEPKANLVHSQSTIFPPSAPPRRKSISREPLVQTLPSRGNLNLKSNLKIEFDSYNSGCSTPDTLKNSSSTTSSTASLSIDSEGSTKDLLLDNNNPLTKCATFTNLHKQMDAVPQENAPPISLHPSKLPRPQPRALKPVAIYENVPSNESQVEPPTTIQQHSFSLRHCQSDASVFTFLKDAQKSLPKAPPRNKKATVVSRDSSLRDISRKDFQWTHL